MSESLIDNTSECAEKRNTATTEEDHAKKDQLEENNNNSNESASTNINNNKTESTIENEESEIVLLRQDPQTKKRVLNKSAYAKLQRNFSNRRSIDVIKVKYENLSDNDVENPFSKKTNLHRSNNVKNDKESVDKIKNRYSAKILEYPIPKPRRLSQKHRHSAPVTKYEEDDSDNKSDELISVVLSNSKSRESLDQIQYELDQYVQMEVGKPKERKRSNSFRRLFSFGKDKKKKDEKAKSKNQNETVHVYSDNIQNESNSFNRHLNYRQSANGTVRSNRDHHQVLNRSNSDDSNQKQLEEKYAQLHISQFNKAKQAFQQPEEYVDMNSKPKNHATYINVPYVQKYIDSSSSNNSSLSEKPNNFDNATTDSANNTLNYSRFHNSNNSNARETPPRAQETRLDVKLVSPKSIENSDRFLHNSLQRDKSEDMQKPQLEETYGTVFDSVERNVRPLRNNLSLPPKPISLEQTKLKLAPNREIYTPSPRVKSPIPAHKVSTEKLIATELLKSPKSPTSNKRIYDSPPSHQSLEIDIDYPDNVKPLNNTNEFSPINKPPKPARLELKKLHIPSPTMHSNNEKIVTSAVIHNQMQTRQSPTPQQNYVNYSNNLLKIRPPSPSPNTQMSPNNNNYYRNASLTNISNNRCATPTNRGPSPGVTASPQKEEIRRNVEAYCWRELKKMKEQETQDLYSYQVQYGYAEDPVMLRRGRSASPTRGSRGRRSLSLPRDPRAPPPSQPMLQYVQGASGQTYIMQANPIPEGRAILNQIPSVHPSYFVRSSPERRTIDGSSSRNLYENYKSNRLYRPIFKRGSLTKQPEEMQQGNKKVSFVNSQVDNGQSWPTRNGFTQSPPQRRIDRAEMNSMEDDVFLPNIPASQNHPVYYGYTNKIPIRDPLYASKNEVLRQQEDIYGQPIDYIPRQSQPLVRRASISSNDPIYGIQNRQYYPQYAPRRREIIANEDEIFGQIGGYQNPAYRQLNDQYFDPRSSQNSLYASRQSIYGKQIAVHNKVCDIYGQIHDNNENPYGKIEKQGVLMGQLQNRHQLMNPLPQTANQQFVRNSRLTASANDMYRQYRASNLDPRYQSDNIVRNNNGYHMEAKAPTRPLPPLPNGKKPVQRNISSELESAPNERIANTKNAKSKKSSFFGKSK